MPEIPLQARLKPYNPQHGYVLRSLTVTALNYATFEQNDHGNKVYPVSGADAKVLRQQTQRPDDPRCTIPAFDILPETEMAALIKREQRARLGLSDSDMDTLQRPDAAPQDPRINAVTREDLRGEEAPAPPRAAPAQAASPAASPRPRKAGGSGAARPS